MFSRLLRAGLIGFVAAPARLRAHQPASDTACYIAAAVRLPTRAGAVRSLVSVFTPSGGMVPPAPNRGQGFGYPTQGSYP